jgi:hypothetical protein
LPAITLTPPSSCILNLQATARTVSSPHYSLTACPVFVSCPFDSGSPPRKPRTPHERPVAAAPPPRKPRTPAERPDTEERPPRKPRTPPERPATEDPPARKLRMSPERPATEDSPARKPLMSPELLITEAPPPRKPRMSPELLTTEDPRPKAPNVARTSRHGRSPGPKATNVARKSRHGRSPGPKAQDVARTSHYGATHGRKPRGTTSSRPAMPRPPPQTKPSGADLTQLRNPNQPHLKGGNERCVMPPRIMSRPPRQRGGVLPRKLNLALWQGQEARGLLAGASTEWVRALGEGLGAEGEDRASFTD